MSVKYCSECGTRLPTENAKFCPECGSKLADSHKAPGVAAEVKGNLEGAMNIAGGDIVNLALGKLQPCRNCDGSGYVTRGSPCRSCNGRGFTKRKLSTWEAERFVKAHDVPWGRTDAEYREWLQETIEECLETSAHITPCRDCGGEGGSGIYDMLDDAFETFAPPDGLLFVWVAPGMTDQTEFRRGEGTIPSREICPICSGTGKIRQ